MKIRQFILFGLGALFLISGGLPEKQRRDHHDQERATELRSPAPETEMAVPDGHTLAEEEERLSPEGSPTGATWVTAHSPKKVKSKKGRKERHNGWALGLGALFSLGALTAAGRYKARKQRKARSKSGRKNREPLFPAWFSTLVGILTGASIAFGVFLLSAFLLGAFPGFGMTALALLAAIGGSIVVALLIGLIWNLVDPPRHSSGLQGCGERFGRALIAVLIIIPLSLFLGGLAVPFFLELIAGITVTFWTGLGIWLICGAGLILAYFIGALVWVQLDYATKPDPEEKAKKKAERKKKKDRVTEDAEAVDEEVEEEDAEETDEGEEED